MIPSIADMVAFQERHRIADHVVYIGDETFVVAHTDPERAAGDLENCPLHLWLVDLEGPPAELMTEMAYRVTPVVGKGAPWHFVSLGGPCRVCGFAEICQDGECHS